MYLLYLKTHRKWFSYKSMSPLEYSGEYYTFDAAIHENKDAFLCTDSETLRQYMLETVGYLISHGGHVVDHLRQID